MDRRIKDVTGQRYGRLTVASYSHTLNSRSYWNCICDCGKTKVVFITCLTQGSTNSCGCIQKEFNRNKKTHGESIGGISPEYRAWTNIKVRCYNPNGAWYKSYGGRGIKVCKRWLESFENFLEDMGRRPSKFHSLDRKKVNGNYCKSNCRWATAIQQSHNMRRNVWITYKGKKMVQADFCRLINTSRTSVMIRVKQKWDINKIAEYYINFRNEHPLAK